MTLTGFYFTHLSPPPKIGLPGVDRPFYGIWLLRRMTSIILYQFLLPTPMLSGFDFSPSRIANVILAVIG